MKSKEILSSWPLPIYEVTEMTMEEALYALSGKGDDQTKSGILSGEVLHRYYQKHPSSPQTH